MKNRKSNDLKALRLQYRIALVHLAIEKEKTIQQAQAMKNAMLLIQGPQYKPELVH